MDDAKGSSGRRSDRISHGQEDALFSETGQPARSPHRHVNRLMAAVLRSFPMDHAGPAELRLASRPVAFPTPSAKRKLLLTGLAPAPLCTPDSCLCRSGRVMA